MTGSALSAVFQKVSFVFVGPLGCALAGVHVIEGELVVGGLSRDELTGEDADAVVAADVHHLGEGEGEGEE